MEIYTHSSQETQLFATLLAQHINKGQIIRLEGPLGSGKTTFTQGLGRALGIQRAIKSPTYTIVKNYPLEEGEFIHIDAYRLEDGGADTVDIDAFMHPNAITLIEWAQFIEDYLPNKYLTIHFALSDDFNQRRLTLEVVNGTHQDQERLEQLVKTWKGRKEHGNRS
ncbi:tRNA (adenosine(37)-N6)-threonylcarbamoyltransferase complex ATPase subunit type 1 TsaE [Aerococcaceae bacterium DSM 111020]|nr:tRNA (adenosine(37)-N6)-threonylcarbamoyltransferase complex ATPase subunit type 1 TsaE [Aerococcaceae bacterium DSM 111020]